MNEIKKYATFSIDLIGTPMRVSSMFSLGRARIFYLGPNPNYSIIEGEVAYKLASTIPGTPIVGLYDYEKEDFEGHGEGQSAYGFVPLDPNPTWVKVDKHEYLEVDVVIWDGRFEEAKDILSEKKSLSMELNPKTLKGSIVQRGDKRYFQITNAEFAGITVLGEEVQPCFKDAGFLTAYSNMVSAYAKYMSNVQEIEKGGIDHMENIDEVKVDEVVEPEINTIEDTVSDVVVEEPTLTVDEPTEPETIEGEEQPADENVEPEAPAEDTNFADNTDEEKCPECGENPCVCKSKCNDEKYQALEAELESYKAKYESLTQELNDALESLKKYTRKEKLEIISKFSTKLEESEELIADLTEKVDDLTEEEIKSQLGNALVEQIAAEEVAKEAEEETSNFSLNINVNHELGNSAWDLVKRHKESK